MEWLSRCIYQKFLLIYPSLNGCCSFGLWPATKDHTVALSLLPPLRSEREWKEGQFNRTANEVNSNNNNTDKKKYVKNKQRNAQCNSHRIMPHSQCSHLASSPDSEQSMMAHGIEYSVLFGQFGSAHPAVSPPGFW